MSEQKARKIVVGLGATGLSCVRFLKDQGHDVLVMDTRSAPPGVETLKEHWPDVECLFGELDEDVLKTAEELVVSPGISIQKGPIANAIASGVKFAGDVELFCRVADRPIVAITGSNGKSTVVTLMGEVLKAAGHSVVVAGNIGLPVLSAWLGC